MAKHKETKLNDASLQIIVNESRLKLDDQLDSVKSLDNKAAIIVSFSGVILSILLTSDVFNENSVAATMIGLFIFLAALFSIIVLLVRAYKRDPDPRNFYVGYVQKKPVKTLEVLAGSFIDSYEKNQKKIIIKKYLINGSFVLMGFASLILFLELANISCEL